MSLSPQNDPRPPRPHTLKPWLIWGLLACQCAASADAPAPAPAPTPPPDAAPAQPPAVFDLMEIQVDGNSVLEVQTIEKAVYPHLGPGKSIADVEQAKQALEKIYRDRGYPTVLVEIPEQDVLEGRVRLQVVEGTIERLKITGSRYYSLGKIREGLSALAAGQVPHMPSVQEQVGRLAQESSDRGLTPVFRAGSTPGKMEAEIKVDDQLPIHGSVEMNGMNTEHTTRSRLIASLRYDNLWQRFHSASLQYQVSPENADEVEVWSGTYVLPTGLADTRLALYGVGISSNNALGATVGGSNVLGTGLIFGARLMKPLPSSGNFIHNLSVGLDYKDFGQTVKQAGQDTGNTPIHYWPFFVGYEAIWRREGSISSASMAGHFTIRGMDNSQKEFEDKRFKSRPDFFYFTAGLKHQHELPWDMRLAFRASGQLADSPLISNEQFSLGGWQTVRGYFQTQQLGDHGVNISTELYTPNLLPAGWEYGQNLRGLAFFDWGYLWILDALPGNPNFYQLASTGVGVRMQLLKHIIGELDWGFPLYRQSTVSPGQSRIDFRVAYEF
ncbi:MAG: ShlB/FhaC/HecB family hemolysin secretion/activation protein [Candidatus Methylumidiphilus sp.]